MRSIAASPPPSVRAKSSTPSMTSVSASAHALLVERVVGGLAVVRLERDVRREVRRHARRGGA